MSAPVIFPVPTLAEAFPRHRRAVEVSEGSDPLSQARCRFNNPPCPVCHSHAYAQNAARHRKDRP